MPLDGVSKSGHRTCAIAIVAAFGTFCSAPSAIAHPFDGNRAIPLAVTTSWRYSAADIRSIGRRVLAPKSKSRVGFIEQPIDFIAVRHRCKLGHLIMEEQNFV